MSHNQKNNENDLNELYNRLNVNAKLDSAIIAR